MDDFKKIMINKQIEWKRKHLGQIIEWGSQNGVKKEYILPWEKREENFLKPIRKILFGKEEGYIKDNNIKPHIGINNLLSSWALCANMYWPFNNTDGHILLKEYLNQYFNLGIYKIIRMELEFEDEDIRFKPRQLLGEDSGIRGSGQTSPDLAILFENNKGENGILLIESKFTESSFYACSGYNKTKSKKPINPDKTRCFHPNLIVDSDFQECHLLTWNRKYWDLIGKELNRDRFLTLKKCPMSNRCYQLFRQQALAKGLEKKYKMAISGVVIDNRNSAITNCMVKDGLGLLPEAWYNLFPNQKFLWLTHNNWYEFVRNHSEKDHWRGWISFVGDRYFEL